MGSGAQMTLGGATPAGDLIGPAAPNARAGAAERPVPARRTVAVEAVYAPELLADLLADTEVAFDPELFDPELFDPELVVNGQEASCVIGTSGGMPVSFSEAERTEDRSSPALSCAAEFAPDCPRTRQADSPRAAWGAAGRRWGLA